MMNETLIQGFRRSFVIALTPVLSDGPLIILMVVVLDQLPESILTALRIIGGVFILYLAYHAWQQSDQAGLFQPNGAGDLRRFTLSKGILINVLNPAPYVFWATVNGPLLVDALDHSALHGVAFLLAFYLPLCGMMLGVGIIFNTFRHFDEKVLRIMLKMAALVLVFFGLSLIAQGVGTL
jgi:threonine/homoserine/homoserine lactone efflux protein